MSDEKLRESIAFEVHKIWAHWMCLDSHKIEERCVDICGDCKKLLKKEE